MKFFSTVGTLVALSTLLAGNLVTAVPSSITSKHCGSRDFNHADDWDHERLLGGILGGSSTTKTIIAQPINVSVSFNVIYNKDGAGKISPNDLLAQIKVLNNDYAKSNVKFMLTAFNYYNKTEWFNMNYNTPAETSMKKTLRRGKASTLNIYTTQLQGGLLGWSTFPQDYKSKPVMDGVVVDFRSLPHGAFNSYNLGRTLTHEVGHWMGLWHTFQDGCTFPNDFIDDTRAEKAPQFNCFGANVTKPVTCLKSDFNQTGYAEFAKMNIADPFDPVTNFMDYVPDSCMNEFTPGQAARMRAQWTFRATA